MANILLVDASFAAFPLYQALVDQGHRVRTIGNRQNDALVGIGEHHVFADYSDVKQLATCIDDHRVDFLVPGCTDRSYASCVAVNRHGRFPGIDTEENFRTLHNKHAFRQRAQQLGLTVPKLLSPDNCLDHLPIIVKPVDAFSGHGISIIDTADRSALDTALDIAQTHSSTGTALIEQFVEGQLHSHSAFWADGRIVSDYVVTEHCVAEPFKVDVSWCSPNFDTSALNQLRAEITTLAAALGLADGLVHTQFILSGKKIWLIEITRRCPGDLYSLLIELSHQPGYCRSYISPFVGKPPNPERQHLQHHILRHTLSVPAREKFTALQCTAPLPLKRYVPVALPGKRAGGLPRRVGIAFYEFPDPRKLEETAGRFLAGTASRTD